MNVAGARCENELTGSFANDILRYLVLTKASRLFSEIPANRETGDEFDGASLSKADASKRIDELRERSPRLAGE